MADSDIKEEQVRHVAELACLSLEPGEVEALCRELGAILAYMAALDGVDVSDVEPAQHAFELETPLRPDRVVSSASRSEVLGAAPESESGGFAVPKVLDSDG